MSDRAEQLAERRAALQLRCSAERQAIAREARSIGNRLESLDRVAAAATGALLHPVVITLGVAAFVALGRARAFRSLGRALLFVSALRRLLQAAKRI